MGEQIFRGLQHAEDLLFDVERAAAPDIAVRDVAGKGGMRPVLLCALNNGNDVLMRHVEAGAQRSVAAGDGDEHGVVADALKRAHAHDVGVACLDVRVQLVELRVVRPTVVKVVDGLAPDGGGQARSRALAVQVGIIALQGKKIGHFFLYHAILSSR